MKSEKPSKTKTTKGAPKAHTGSGGGRPEPGEPAAIPPILLEGDAPAPPSGSGPGRRYALGVTGGPSPSSEEAGELPEAYGTQRLMLTARDPHWVYAHWDLTREQLQHYNSQSVDKHLVLRMYKETLSGQPLSETHVHPESRNWFVHVGLSDTKFLAELGYYQKGGKWKQVSISGATLTPPDSLSDDLSVRFETIPVDVPLDDLTAMVRKLLAGNVPLMEALRQLRAEGHSALPADPGVPEGQWTREQEEALSRVVTMDAVRRVWMGSLEITELLRRQLIRELSSGVVSQFSVPGSWSGVVSSWSSPLGGMERRKSFWFNVNAELIIYGATEPDAEVSIGGRLVQLRRDGTFSFRFALPDGKFDLPVVAVSADGSDSRCAALKFARSTQYRGDVGQHPQDPNLKPPVVASLP